MRRANLKLPKKVPQKQAKKRVKKSLKKSIYFLQQKNRQKSSVKIDKKMHVFLKKEISKMFRYNHNKIKIKLFEKPICKIFLKKLFVFLINFIYIFCVIFSQ